MGFSNVLRKYMRTWAKDLKVYSYNFIFLLSLDGRGQGEDGSHCNPPPSNSLPPEEGDKS